MASKCQSQEKDFFEIRYYNPNRICLSLIGLWPYATLKERFIRTVIVSSVLLLHLIVQVGTMMKVNVEIFIEVLSNFLVYLIGVSIYYNNVINMSKLSFILEFIKRDWLEQKAPKHLEIMKEYGEVGRKYALILIVSAYGLIVISIFLSAGSIILDVIVPLNTTRPRISPFPVELFFDQQEHFLLSLLIIFTLMSAFCLVSASNYMLFIVIVQYICGMFRVVGSMLDDAIDAKTVSMHNHNSEARAYELIVQSIKYHKRVLEFDAAFNSSIDKCLILVLFFTVIFLMAAFVRLLQNDAVAPERMRETVLSIANIIFHCGLLYITSSLGQKIIDHSASLFDKAYDMPWYVLSNCKKSQTLVSFMMMRSLKPSCIMIAKFFTLSLKFCATIVQSAMSYAMVIYSVR